MITAPDAAASATWSGSRERAPASIQERRAMQVDALQLRVIGRRGWHAVEHHPHEGVPGAGLKSVIAISLAADRGVRRLADLLATGRARGVTGIDEDIIVEQAQTVHDGVIELGREFLDLVSAEQIGPADLADEERIAREERDRIRTLARDRISR